MIFTDHIPSQINVSFILISSHLASVITANKIEPPDGIGSIGSALNLKCSVDFACSPVDKVKRGRDKALMMLMAIDANGWSALQK